MTDHCPGCCACRPVRGEHPDVAAVLEMNRLTCEHEGVPNVVPRADVEAWLKAGGMAGGGRRYLFWWCRRCESQVPCYPPREEAVAA